MLQRLHILQVSLPANLLSLTFGRQFNRSLKGLLLPDSLQVLAFGDLSSKESELKAFPLADGTCCPTEVLIISPDDLWLWTHSLV